MSSWTLTIADPRKLLDAATVSLIDTDVAFVLGYLDRFLDWQGTLDVQVNIKTYADLKSELGWDIDGIFAATEMGWYARDGKLFKSNLVEMAGGADPNGTAPDAGFTIYLGKDGTMRSYGTPVWLDPDPAFHAGPSVPAGGHDLVSIALHEMLHTLAFDQADFATGTLGSKVTFLDGAYWFSGEATVALLGGPLPFDASGHIISSRTPHYGVSGVNSDWGNYDQNRWDIGRIELAVLQDLGFDVQLPPDGLPYADLDDKAPRLAGTAGDDLLYGDYQANELRGGTGNDLLEGGAGNDTLDGGTGLDTALYAGAAAGFDVRQHSGVTTVIDKAGAEGRDLLAGIERIQFDDSARAFDTAGTAGMAYRIYQAAFDRAPDHAGLGYWIDRMDHGATLDELATNFILSTEFRDLYGADLAAGAYITQLYDNVLHRAPDSTGYDFWLSALIGNGNGNDTLATRAGILARFSESPENVGQVAEAIGAGIAYLPWGA
ncbi:DUF4214 domain-containing protein [Pseudoduganella lutea]|uniref:DUF4214 domain-containing protein n=1 Tax=Pseudoduganella lutea TaxID=321985 RepID=A0A4P6KYM4_9BURK|nr:DUF4214 domain-containing protein [Pseudoduganella lutea]QBE64319.1 DUF4214 domain-containing protein [Pseudoduganella lutea]